MRGRKVSDPWRAFAFAGAGWWAVWAVATVVAGLRAHGNDAYVEYDFDDRLAWAVMLGAVGNFIWAVQSRSVPIFFGRKTPSLGQVIVPGFMFNAGALLVLMAGLGGSDEAAGRLLGVGFVLAGVGMAWLAPVAGSCWGHARRLRPRARPAARFVVVANLFAVASALLLVWAGIDVFLDGQFAAVGVRDAARHAFGLGVITLLIVGMAQLVAPFFAVRRVESGGDWMTQAIFGLLAAAALLRTISALLAGHAGLDARMHLAAAAGSLGWLGLVLFAVTVLRAVRGEAAITESLRTAVAPPAGPRA